ncbi:phosphoribosyltransferase [Streptomyces sp. ACA25]|uniref:phosphoribosyltransferase n=1 Tax=Streptomyces sp. ACA25 TaxID=3022596 RepID=UPI0023083603|nr:phosphoribosyltransferase [Streptomyces sp. ACA25]MDB1087761.1 phosphoribosyltransferase [Streptomyces sp. ACA25]
MNRNENPSGHRGQQIPVTGGSTAPRTPGGTRPGAPWTGDWVGERLGVRLHGAGLRELLGLALRRNAKRAQLLVSPVLGKHVPQRPAAVRAAGDALGSLVREALGEDAGRAVVLGYAETATALGHCVADRLDSAPYLHSTRRPVAGIGPVGGFEEEHSHATSHLLLPADPQLLAGTGPLVLVDDELSTGRTVRNTVEALHRQWPRERYVVAALVDLRTPEDAAGLDKWAAGLGVRADVVALASGTVHLPDGVLDRAAALVTAHQPLEDTDRPAGRSRSADTDRPAAQRVDLGWPARLPEGGRHGFTPAHRARLEAALPAMADRLAATLPRTARRILVLGTEELMYTPLRLAAALEHRHGERTEVLFSTTSRSPALPVDDPGYAIRTGLTFPAHDDPADGPGPRYAYNVADGGWDAVVLVTDSAGDTPALHAPGGLTDRLAAHTAHLLLTVLPCHVPEPRPATAPRRTLPATGPPHAPVPHGAPHPLRGPHFSSYAPDEVGWLLQDLSHVTLEAPTEEREEAIQRGGAHYAESLPVEYQPSAEYQRLFHSALDASAPRIARAVATVTDMVLADRHPAGRPRGRSGPVLVSLARAGTPVGVLMRRWAQHAHGLDLPHYAVSIVRGRGIDTAALRWLATHHDPADTVFVDGWTGKGAIARELTEALRPEPGFDPSLVVLADPGACVTTYGTREDFLIPSACLNSTVSGLVSRTVLRADLVRDGQFHGAKYYRELAGADVSGHFLDAVTAHFPTTTPDPPPPPGERTATWAGRQAVERISEEYGIGDLNLVKPGVGETTRVLLRRVPWRVLARRGTGADLDHIRLLAAQRGVPVEETDELPYSCVGLIHPRYTRGATGADGKAAR